MNEAKVKLAWTLSDQPSYSEGGQPITEYDIQILQSDGLTFSRESTYCGPSEQMKQNKFCEIPMVTLTSNSGPFKLGLG
jgi:hypothetical protein